MKVIRLVSQVSWRPVRGLGNPHLPRKENRGAEQNATDLRYRTHTNEVVSGSYLVESTFHLLERRSSVRVSEAFPSEPIGQSRERRHKTKPSNRIERRFKLEKERAAWRPVEAVVS